MKNPVSPLWDREIFAQNPYTLTDLCRHADLYGKAAELQVQCPKGRQSVPDHPAAEIAVQSNQPFRELAAWARQNVDRFRGAGIPLQTFQNAVEDEALRIYRELDSTSHGIERPAHNTAQSVARWTWQNYHCRKLASRPAITAVGGVDPCGDIVCFLWTFPPQINSGGSAEPPFSLALKGLSNLTTFLLPRYVSLARAEQYCIPPFLFPKAWCAFPFPPSPPLPSYHLPYSPNYAQRTEGARVTRRPRRDPHARLPCYIRATAEHEEGSR
jgi:hypothetical protein